MRKTYSAKTRRNVWSEFGGKCHLCGRDVDFKEMTLDHIVSLGNGGEDAIHNLAPAHKTCNQRRGIMSVNAWRALTSVVKIFR